MCGRGGSSSPRRGGAGVDTAREREYVIGWRVGGGLAEAYLISERARTSRLFTHHYPCREVRRGKVIAGRRPPCTHLASVHHEALSFVVFSLYSYLRQRS